MKLAMKFAFLISSAMSLFGYVLLRFSDFIGLCNYFDCYVITFRIGEPLFYGAGALAIVFLALAVYPASLRAWKVFAVWYLPIAIFFFLFSRDPGSGDFITPYPEQIYQWTGGIYVVLGLSVVLGSGLVSRKAGEGIENAPLIRNRYLQILWYAYLAFLIFSAAQFLLSD